MIIWKEKQTKLKWWFKNLTVDGAGCGAKSSEMNKVFKITQYVSIKLNKVIFRTEYNLSTC